jgi:hypothetical protein
VGLFRDRDGMNAGQRRAYRLYQWSMVSYVASLPVAFALTRHFTAWRGKSVFMLLPLAAVALILRAMMAFFSAADEMQRRILAEGSAYALVTNIFLTVVCGFFEGTVIPVIPWWARFVFMMLSWGVAVTVAKARYK